MTCGDPIQRQLPLEISGSLTLPYRALNASRQFLQLSAEVSAAAAASPPQRTAVACYAGCEKEHNNYSFHNFAIQEGTAQFGSKNVLTISKIKEDKRKIPLVNADRK